jgi:hypothetical protein
MFAMPAEWPSDFQSLVKAGLMRDNNILTRLIELADRRLGLGFVNWRCQLSPTSDAFHYVLESLLIEVCLRVCEKVIA